MIAKDVCMSLWLNGSVTFVVAYTASMRDLKLLCLNLKSCSRANQGAMSSSPETVI